MVTVGRCATRSRHARKRWPGWLLVCLSLLPCLEPALAQQRVTVGVVTDGPMGELNRARELFFGEVLKLTEGEFEVRFPEAKQLDGGWSIDRVRAALQQLQDDTEVDLVLGLGFVSSLVASTGVRLRKPTFAPLVIDAQLFGLPRQGNTSGIANLSYLTEEVQFPDDLATFRSIANFDRLALVVDGTIAESVPDLARRANQWARQQEVELRFVFNTRADENLAAKIPADIEAVMVAALPRLDAAARKRFIDGLLERRLPSFSLIATTPVRQGMLAAVEPDSDWQRLARRNALNMQAVLIGERAGDQPVAFRHKRQLTINMATARALDIHPRFDILSEAVLINEELPSTDVVAWSLADVAGEALAVNLEIRASIAGVRAGEQIVRTARAERRPQISASSRAAQFDDNSASVRNGVAAERNLTGVIDLSQIVYSEAINANVDVQRSLQSALEASHRTLELDIVREATVAFLNVLKAKTFLAISQRELDLTRTNLELARDRVRLGSSNASDVFRWDSQLATTRRDLLANRAQLLSAMNNLNRILHRPIDQRFDTVPATLSDPSLLISRPEVLDLIDNQRAFDRMGELFVVQGLDNSPELIQLDAQITATARDLKSARRAYWSPDVLLNGQVSEIFEESRVAGESLEGESDWQLSLNFSLPLFQGGARRARVSRARFELKQLELLRQASRDTVEQTIRSNLHAVRASYPSIELAQKAAVAARKNLDLVRDNYSQGTVSIIDLLDAQDSALDAEQNATNATYDFLIDLMNLQRATAQFDFFLSAIGTDRAVEAIKRAVTEPESKTR